MHSATQSTQTIRLHKTFLRQEIFEVFENRQRKADMKGNGEDIRGSRGAGLGFRCETYAMLLPQLPLPPRPHLYHK